MTRNASLLALAAFFATSSPALAFDCSKASTEVEKAICANPDLKQLDDELGEAYLAIKASSSDSEKKMLARSQKRWIESREQCPDAEAGLEKCIRDALEERLRLFRGEAETGPGTGSNMMPVFIVQDGNEKVYDLDIEVLRFVQPQGKGEKKFNAIVNGILGKAVIGPHGQDTMGSTYAQQDGITLTYASPAFMSVLHSFWSDEGGAHGNGGVENFNLDMKTGKLLKFSDILPKTAASKLQAKCKDQIIAEKKERNADIADYSVDTDEFLEDSVIAEHIGDLGRWSIGAEQITVTFDAYAIGAYAEGSYDCSFPTADVKAMATPGAPLPQ